LPDDEFGIAPHTDTSFLTLPAPNDVPGLAFRTPAGHWPRASADGGGGAEDAQVVAAGDLAGLGDGEAAAEHCRNEVHPLCVIPRRNRARRTGRCDADNVGHLFQAVDVFVEAGKEMPNPDRGASSTDCRAHLLGRLRDIADQAEPVTGVDYLGACFWYVACRMSKNTSGGAECTPRNAVGNHLGLPS
jgi:hypothetical protein